MAHRERGFKYEGKKNATPEQERDLQKIVRAGYKYFYSKPHRRKEAVALRKLHISKTAIGGW